MKKKKYGSCCPREEGEKNWKKKKLSLLFIDFSYNQVKIHQNTCSILIGCKLMTHVILETSFGYHLACFSLVENYDSCNSRIFLASICMKLFWFLIFKFTRLSGSDFPNIGKLYIKTLRISSWSSFRY